MGEAAGNSLAIGFFDGVHRGHAAILGKAGMAMTFRNHPLTVLCPERAPKLIMTLEERVRRIRELGVEKVEVLEFDRKLAEMTAEEFAERILRPMGAGKIYAGGNWRFGKGGKADIGWLKRAGWEAEEIGYETYLGETVSSTRIRKTLAGGDMAGAAAMLGRNWRLTGKRTAGKGEGRKIGYPTINIVPDSELVAIPNGVYEARLGGKMAIANYGTAPTFGERAWEMPVCEVHILEEGEAEGELELARFVRPERKFGTVEELKAQIRRDIDGIL